MTKDEVQKTIIEGACGLFLLHGCKKVTMDQIAQEVHVSKRTIYEQFADKGALLDACMAAKFDHLVHAHKMPPQEEDLPLLMMLAAVQVHADTMNRHERMMKDLQDHYPEVYDRHIGKLRQAFVESLQSILENDQKLGRIRADVDPRIAAHAVVAMALYDQGQVAMAGGDLKQAHKVLSDVIYTYMRGLLTERLLKEYDSRQEELLTTWKRMIDKHASGFCHGCSEQEMIKESKK
ncbi:MAG: TetR/AcrR family transcriptional regulator [Bacteroidales bacterium]|nr:TetR/AcrR family transcriptional regulator [Bacteroidales bacterium]